MLRIFGRRRSFDPDGAATIVHSALRFIEGIEKSTGEITGAIAASPFKDLDAERQAAVLAELAKLEKRLELAGQRDFLATVRKASRILATRLTSAREEAGAAACWARIWSGDAPVVHGGRPQGQ